MVIIQLLLLCILFTVCSLRRYPELPTSGISVSSQCIVYSMLNLITLHTGTWKCKMEHDSMLWYWEGCMHVFNCTLYKKIICVWRLWLFSSQNFAPLKYDSELATSEFWFIIYSFSVRFSPLLPTSSCIHNSTLTRNPISLPFVLTNKEHVTLISMCTFDVENLPHRDETYVMYKTNSPFPEAAPTFSILWWENREKPSKMYSWSSKSIVVGFLVWKQAFKHWWQKNPW